MEIVYRAIARIFEAFKLKPLTTKQFRKATSHSHEWLYANGVPEDTPGDELVKIFAASVSSERKKRKLRPYALKLLYRCEQLGIKIVVISALNSDLLTQQIRDVGLTGRFDKVIGGAREKAGPIADTVKEFGVSPDESIYIGDMVSDVEASKKAGVVSFGFTGGYNEAHLIVAAKPDFAVGTLKKAISVIEKGVRR